jgi:hypothetical protein
LNDDTGLAWFPAAWISLAAAAVGGLVFALWMVPTEMLNPTVWEWLLQGDLAPHFLGWHFFRTESWSFPPGRLWSYGEAMGSSVVYTDSIPLFALLLKPLSAALPQHFQYAGLWSALALMLGPVFAWRCGFLATRNHVAGLFFAILVVTVPMATIRVLAGHIALASHWIVLWSLSEYLEPGPRIAWWRRSFCLAIAALVHAYVLFIVFAIIAAELTRRWLVLNQFDGRGVIRRGAASLLTLGITMWVAGYFAIRKPGDPDRQFGQYGADLDAWFNPIEGSRFLDWHQPTLQRGLDGVHYLGFGVLLLMFLGLVLSVPRWREVKRRLSPHWPLILFAGVLALLAFTHELGIGGRTVLALPLPERMLSAFSFFRASGRFLWLADYALMLLAVAAAFWLLPKRFAITMVLLAVLLQLADLGVPLSSWRDRLAQRAATRLAAEGPVLISPFWQDASTRYRRVAIAPMQFSPPGYAPLGLYAADHGLSINSGRMARVDWPEQAAKQLITELGSGALRADTLYVVNDPDLIVLSALSPNDGVGRVDGMLVVAPGWFTGVACCLSRPAELRLSDLSRPGPAN